MGRSQKSAFDDIIKRKKDRPKKEKHSEYADLIQKCRENGPVWFAENVLTTPPKVPCYPNWKKHQKTLYCEGCEKEHTKFHEGTFAITDGTPYHLILSDDQKEFLNDLWKNKVRWIILVAARGAGKTFILSIYIVWKLVCSNNYSATCMGGSQTQSQIIQGNIDTWRRDVPLVKHMITSSIAGGRKTPQCRTRNNNVAYFPPCSEAASRGPHVIDLAIDEVCVAERDKEGRIAVRGARFQLTGSGDPHFMLISTAQYIHGDFYQTWKNAKKLGFKRYRWAIAKHINEKPFVSSRNRDWKTLDSLLYKDTEPKHWLPSVWWETVDDIQQLRKEKDNDTFLVEALGGISVGSGLIFHPDYIKVIVCDECEKQGLYCDPYKEGHCFLPQKIMFQCGTPLNQLPKSTTEALRFIRDRVEGVDWGEGRSPDAFTCFGIYNEKVVLVLDHVEEFIADDKMKIARAYDLAKKWNIPIIRPDPAQPYYNNELTARGLAVWDIFEKGGQQKDMYLHYCKKFIERKAIIIPKAFVALIRSLSNLSYDPNRSGKVLKQDDHSYDAFSYGLAHYGERLSPEAQMWQEGGFLETLPLSELTIEEKRIRKKQKDIKLEAPTSEICHIIEDKLSSVWGEPLTREEKYHIANCDRCSKLWAKWRQGGNLGDMWGR